MPDRVNSQHWAIVVHGGAKEIPPEQAERHRAGVAAAAEVGQAVLARGGCATDAVEAAIRALEEDPTFNAARGSVRNSDGDVECDAAIMNGETLDVGGVGAVRRLKHPISVAAALLTQKETLLVAEGAERFAEDHGAELVDPEQLNPTGDETATDALDTVGAVAMDDMGRIAAGTSTGGLPGSLPGRVGDSPLPGCGLYAEDGIGGVALSGDGESISRVALAAHVMASLDAGVGSNPIGAALERLERVEGEAGIILLDSHGRVRWGHNSPDFAVAYTDARTPVRAYLRVTEDETQGVG